MGYNKSLHNFLPQNGLPFVTPALEKGDLIAVNFRINHVNTVCNMKAIDFPIICKTAEFSV
jgi:hypothetical protein